MSNTPKLVAVAVTAFIAGSFCLNAVHAWSSTVVPDCDSDYILGRDSASIDRPSRLARTELSLPSDAEETIKSFFGTGSILPRAIMNVPNSGISNILMFNQTMYRGYGQNAPEVRDRFMAASFSNILKLECRLRVGMYYLGFPIDRATMVNVNDSAPYDKDARNHTLYQRTDDLEQQIRLMRQDITNLAHSMNASSFQSATNPLRDNTSVFNAPAPKGNMTPPSASGTMSAADIAMLKACTDACASTGQACAATSKMPQECVSAQAVCTNGCQDIIKH